MKYDKEEKTILDAYKKGKMTLSSPSKKEIPPYTVPATSIGRSRCPCQCA
jgi:hypothetical protein